MKNLAEAGLALGDTILVSFVDSQRPPMHAVVAHFLTDQQEGLAPEIEDYAACWLEIQPCEASLSMRTIMLGTDFKYSMDGYQVTITKT